MKKNILHGFKFLVSVLAIVMSLSIFAFANASTGNYERSNQIALEALSKKIKTDLGVSDIRLKYEKVNQYNISKSTIGVKGNAKYLINSEIFTPLSFDVKVNTADFTVADVVYDFEEASDALAAGSPFEERLTQKLLKQIGSEYKTTNVVISIDNLETLESGLRGTGEVRIGDFEWRRIEFDAALSKKGVAAVKYKIEK